MLPAMRLEAAASVTGQSECSDYGQHTWEYLGSNGGGPLSGEFYYRCGCGASKTIAGGLVTIGEPAGTR